MKKTTIKKTISLLLTFILSLSTIPFTALSASAATASDWQMPMANAYCTWKSSENWSWATYTSNASGRNYHLGIDIYGTNGTVNAAANGKVVAASSSNSGANGRYIILQHTLSGKSVYSFYAHLKTVNVSVGQTVSRGTKIGVAGGSAYGNNNYYGTHLHFAIVDTLWTNGSYYGYATRFTGNSVNYKNVTFYNPVYVINNGILPGTEGTDSSAAAPTVSPGKSNASAAEVQDLLFHANFYANIYEDLRNAFGSNAKSLKNHWFEYGIKEGRVASVFFDAKWYMANNADVAAAYGATNWAGAYTHFIHNGFNEGRQGSPYFNAPEYLNRYPDLKNAFGNNYLAAAKHFLSHGLAENRQASSQFSIAVYSQHNPDVVRVFSNPLYRISHYISYVQYGSENRKCV